MTCARDIKPAPPPALPDDLIDVAEVARITGRTKRTVRLWAKRLTAYKRFGRIYYSKADIDAAVIVCTPKDPSR